MPDSSKNRRLLACGLGAAAVALVVFQLAGQRDGYLLRKGDLDAAKQHLGVRHELRALEAVLAQAAEPVDPLQRAADEVRYAGLRLDRNMSLFAGVSDADLNHAVEAAEDGRYIEEGLTDGSKGQHGDEDDRMDVAAVVTAIAEELLPTGDGQRRVFLEKALERSRSVGAWMHAYSLGSGTTNVPIRAGTLGAKRRLCDGQRFAAQPRAALGTAFLVRPDTVLTAAHAVLGHELPELRLVFDFVVQQAKQNPTVCREVYTAKKLLLHDEGDGEYDWALVQLDREVVGGVPLALAKNSYALLENAPVYLWGHSAGTPKKFVEGIVYENEGDISMRMELDAFGGDSGAPVFNEEHEVAGLLYGGSMDWVKRRGGCYEVARVWIDEGGELVTRVENLPGNWRR